MWKAGVYWCVFLLLKVTSSFEKACFIFILCFNKHFYSYYVHKHIIPIPHFFRESTRLQRALRLFILDQADIEIRDLQCQSGRTWQPLTCCDALVCSLADNPSRPLQQKQTDNRVHACTLSPSSHVKHKQTWTCRAPDAHTHSLGSLLMSEYTLVGYERWRETASDNLNLTETSNTELHLISLLHLLRTLSQHLRACAHFILC